MPALFTNNLAAITELRDQARRGDRTSQVIMSLLDNTYYVAMTAGAEGGPGANLIKVSGRVKDQDGQNVLGVKNVVVRARPIAGAGTMTDGGKGTLKFGSTTTEVWLETDANGEFELNVLNATAEDTLMIATLDNGTTEMLKLTFA